MNECNAVQVQNILCDVLLCALFILPLSFVCKSSQTCLSSFMLLPLFYSLLLSHRNIHYASLILAYQVSRSLLLRLSLIHPITFLWNVVSTLFFCIGVVGCSYLTYINPQALNIIFYSPLLSHMPHSRKKVRAFIDDSAVESNNGDNISDEYVPIPLYFCAYWAWIYMPTLLLFYFFVWLILLSVDCLSIPTTMIG
jgi:hypothetical protein